jgi:hypothetical protein
MIGWNRRTVRHIPEEELHAYLDQALSRSQCVEIERHLARCGSCQRQRDHIAALRDRTTALLARIGPPLVIPPPFSQLKERAVARQAGRPRWVTSGVWAAGIAAAILLGWQLNRQLEPVTTPLAAAPVGPAVEPGTAVDLTIPPVHVAAASRSSKAISRPPRQLVRSSRPVGDAAPSSSDFASAIETDSTSYLPTTGARQLALAQAPLAMTPAALSFDDFAAQPVNADPGLQGLWRTITPDDGAPELATDIALVPGLPVVQMRQQPGIGTDDVTTAVDQTLESGKVIRTISGPVARVLTLVDEDARADSASAVVGTQDRTTVTIRQGGRMVAVTGPTQELGWLLSKVNMKSAKRRY